MSYPYWSCMFERFSDQINHPDKDFRFATDPRRSAWALAHNTDLAYFGPDGWLEQHPEEAKEFASTYAHSLQIVYVVLSCLHIGCLSIAVWAQWVR